MNSAVTVTSNKMKMMAATKTYFQQFHSNILSGSGPYNKELVKDMVPKLFATHKHNLFWFVANLALL